MTNDMPKEIWAELTPPDQTGQFWLIDTHAVTGRTKYVRADLVEKPVDAEVREAIKIFDGYSEKSVYFSAIQTLIRAVEENSTAYRMTKAMLEGALQANVNLHKKLEAATKNMGEK